MKKFLLVPALVIVVVPLIGIGVLFAIREPPDGPRTEVARGIVGVEAGGAYAWIVRTAHGAVLVDAGLDARGTAILEELRREGLGPDDVEAVLLTHGHPDHYAAARMFRKARVLLGGADRPMLRGDTAHYGIFGRIMAAVMPLPAPPEVITPLQGDERFDFDGAIFDVIATPGHTPGSVMYLHKEVLFTGDSLMRKTDGLAVAPSLFSDDAPQNRASLRQLRPLAFDKVADGHAGVTTNAKVKLNRLLAGWSGGAEVTATR